MLNEEQIWKLVDAKRAEFIALSDRVFETPETLYNEFASVAEHVAALKAEGFARYRRHLRHANCGHGRSWNRRAGDCHSW